MGKEENSLLGESSSKSTTDEVLDTLCPKLSYTERLYGFCIASAIGIKKLNNSRLANLFCIIYFLFQRGNNQIRNYFYYWEYRLRWRVIDKRYNLKELVFLQVQSLKRKK